MVTWGNDHMSRMHESSPDLIALVTMIEENIKEVSRLYFRKHDTELRIPESLKEDAKRWRTLFHRHRAGDFRFKKAERRSTEAMAQWTLDIKADIVGKERKVHEFQWDTPQAK